MSSLVKEIGAGHGHHCRIAAAVFAHVVDDCIDVGEESHGGDQRWTACIRVAEHIEFQVADVAGEDFDFAETAVVMLGLLSVVSLLLRGGFVGHVRRIFDRAEVDVEMLVVAHIAEISGEFEGEGVPIDDAIVVAGLLMGADGVDHFLADFRVDVVLGEIGGDAVDDMSALIGVDLDVLDYGARWDGTQAEVVYHVRLRGVEQNAADGDGCAGFLFDTETDLQRLAALDGEKIEAAGLCAEVMEEIDSRLRGVVFDVCSNLGFIAAVEGVEEG